MQWGSQNVEQVTLLKGRLLDLAVILFNFPTFSKWELILKNNLVPEGANSFL